MFHRPLQAGGEKVKQLKDEKLQQRAWICLDRAEMGNGQNMAEWPCQIGCSKHLKLIMKNFKNTEMSSKTRRLGQIFFSMSH